MRPEQISQMGTTPSNTGTYDPQSQNTATTAIKSSCGGEELQS